MQISALTHNCTAAVGRALPDVKKSTALELAAGTYSAGGPGPFAGRPGRFDQRFIFRGVQLTGERYVEHLPDLETAFAD